MKKSKMRSFINGNGYFSTTFRIGDKMVKVWKGKEEVEVLEKGKVHVCRVVEKRNIPLRKEMKKEDQEAYFVRGMNGNDELKNDDSEWFKFFTDFKGDSFNEVWEKAYAYVATN